MNFISSVIEGTGVIEQIFGSSSKEMKSFQRVLQGYAIKGIKTREDIKAKFEQITKKFTDKVVEIAKRAIEKAKKTPADITDILLVGGSSRMPPAA